MHDVLVGRCERIGRLTTAAIVVGVTAGCGFTVLVAGGSGRLESLPVRVTYDLLAAILLVSWLLVCAARTSWLPASKLWPAILACVGSFALASATSRVPRLSLEATAYVVLLSGLYVFLVALMRRPRFRAHIERLALALCVAVGVLYLLEVARAWSVWWEAVGAIVLPPLRPGYLGLSLGSPNPVATVVLVLGAFALATSAGPGRRGRLAVAVLIAMLGAVTLVSGSRGAWLGLAAGLTAAALVALAAEPGARARVRAAIGTRTGPIAAVVGSALLAAAGIAAARSGRLTLDDGGYREAFAVASMRMFTSAPVTGTGPGTWQTLRAANQDAGQPDLYIPHAHSVYTQTLAEFGFLGIAAGVIALASLAVLVARALRTDDAAGRHVAVATVFATVLLAVQQTADMLMNVPAVVLAVALPIAWLDARALGEPIAPPANERPHTGWRRRAAGGGAVGGAIGVAVLSVWLLTLESVALVANQAVARADDGRWDEAASLAATAVAADPDLAPYQLTLGVAAARTDDLAAATDALATSAATDDYPYAWLALASVRWRSGDTEGARRALDGAERIGLRDPQVALAAGWLRERLGDEEQAIADDAAALVAAPTLAADPYWASSGWLRTAGPAILATARRLAPDRGLAIDLFGGRMEAARAAAARSAALDPELYPLIVPAWSGDVDAWAALQALAVRRPLDGSPASWARTVALRRGDMDAVARYDTWLATLTGTDAGLPFVAHVTFDAPGLQPPRMLDRYGSLYRRTVPRALVDRILPQITWRAGL